jgi:hypothetical protein
MAAPTPYALVMYRGDSYTWVFRFWLDAAKTQPADLTGYAVAAAIAGEAGHVALPCVLTLPHEVAITVTGSTWGSLGPGAGRWDLQLTDPDGWVHTPIAGAVTVRADVTDAPYLEVVR